MEWSKVERRIVGCSVPLVPFGKVKENKIVPTEEIFLQYSHA
jgi:hypothetical protein